MKAYIDRYRNAYGVEPICKVLQIAPSCYRRHAAQMRNPPADLDTEEWTERVRRNRPFVAEHDGEVVGYADIQSGGYIDQFFVSGAHPRQGIGTMLMERVFQEAESLGLTELTADVSKTAEPFFLRHGFQVVERRFPVRRGVTLQNSLMRKKLKARI